MSSFFLPDKRSKRRKASGQDVKATGGRAKPKGKSVLGKPKSRSKVTKHRLADEEISSASEDESTSRKRPPAGREEEEEEQEEEREETAPEKRLRLAKEYLSLVEEQEKEERELEEIDRDAIAHRLKQDVLEQAGRLQRKLADLYHPPAAEEIRFFRGHQLPVTCVAIAPDDQCVYSASKDSSIIKWNVSSGKKVVIFPGQRKGEQGSGFVGHRGHVFALALSSDGKFLASGGQDKVIHIWDGSKHLHLHTFTGHRDSVSGLAFQVGSHELFSCSFDRTVKIWNLDEMAYVETLFGHQDSVTSIDCLARERPITSGASDRSIRAWKIVDESQLVFHGHKASIDCVRLINESYFITGSQDGKIALWSMTKKRPLVSTAHQLIKPEKIGEEGEGEEEEEEGVRSSPSQQEHWITAVAALPNSDLVASGSNDGFVRLWRCGDKFQSLSVLFSIQCAGFINSLVFSRGGDFLVAAVGQEHRFGRWWKEKGVRNTVAILPLHKHKKDFKQK